MNSILPADFATEKQIARNHDRVRELPDRSVSLLADWEQQERTRQAASQAQHAAGNDLPLFE